MVGQVSTILRLSALENYRNDMKNHVTPYLGQKQPTQITAADLRKSGQRFLAQFDSKKRPQSNEALGTAFLLLGCCGIGMAYTVLSSRTVAVSPSWVWLGLTTVKRAKKAAHESAWKNMDGHGRLLLFFERWRVRVVRCSKNPQIQPICISGALFYAF